MDPDVILSLGIVAGSSLTAALGLGLAWRRAAARVEALEARLLSAPGSGTGDYVAQQVEALAHQVEALRDGQEFLTRVLAQPPAAASPLAPPLEQQPRPRATDAERTPH